MQTEEIDTTPYQNMSDNEIEGLTRLRKDEEMEETTEINVDENSEGEEEEEEEEIEITVQSQDMLSQKDSQGTNKGHNTMVTNDEDEEMVDITGSNSSEETSEKKTKKDKSSSKRKSSAPKKSKSHESNEETTNEERNESNSKSKKEKKSEKKDRKDKKEKDLGATDGVEKKKHRRHKPGHAAKKEIKQLQARTKTVSARAPMDRLIREICSEVCPQEMKFKAEAIDSIHQAAELFLTELADMANMLTHHRGRRTLDPRDLFALLKTDSLYRKIFRAYVERAEGPYLAKMKETNERVKETRRKNKEMKGAAVVSN